MSEKNKLESWNPGINESFLLWSVFIYPQEAPTCFIMDLKEHACQPETGHCHCNSIWMWTDDQTHTAEDKVWCLISKALLQSKCLPKESKGMTYNHSKSSSAVRLAFTARDCKYFTPPCGCRGNRLHFILETLNTQENEIFKGLTLVMTNSNELVMIHWLRPKYKAVRFINSFDLIFNTYTS